MICQLEKLLSRGAKKLKDFEDQKNSFEAPGQNGSRGFRQERFV